MPSLRNQTIQISVCTILTEAPWSAPASLSPLILLTGRVRRRAGLAAQRVGPKQAGIEKYAGEERRTGRVEKRGERGMENV
ncbi:hypothetical protein PICMEDRAFT_124654 [Pichia membranifaciens NRRL Y-2026]|uniref:Uncharacterized protein n=1 Tax=Pichia membranifaciens NRRL Y-2026 TaxID=763406 RepID=A0A1E3NQ01_9ASCO|nr:hypothetical protein PICMEDRAFT_124654 [Pichia membranifaciens NRRL Y-2026]ODQ48194.1 hypothetical protein PICMEDRAFT_124654 [Pichia membranifaciens NRRL Y-2026]